MWKKEGETPLDALKRLKNKAFSAYPSSTPFSYAGRLDPIAQGALPVVYGKAIAKKDAILALKKTYRAGILLGFSTDSWDIFGVVRKKRACDVARKHIQDALKTFKGEVHLPVPLYSSVPVGGRSLHEWARKKGVLHQKLPQRAMAFSQLELVSMKRISNATVRKRCEKFVEKIKGDFRHSAIHTSWANRTKDSKEIHTLISVQIECSSGSYIRSLAHSLGEKLGVGACVYSLSRSHVGRYGRKQCTKA